MKTAGAAPRHVLWLRVAMLAVIALSLFRASPRPLGLGVAVVGLGVALIAAATIIGLTRRRARTRP